MTVEPVAVELIEPGNRFRKDMGDLEPLKASIKNIGLLHPITVTSSWKLVAGGRRLQACRELGWTEISAKVIDVDNLLQVESDENEIRKEMTASEKTALAEEIEKLLKTGEKNGGHLTPSINKGKKRPIVARKAGFDSEMELRRARLVAEKACESVRELVDDKTVTVSDAASIADMPHDIQEKAIGNLLYGATTTLKKGAELAMQQQEADAGTAEAIRDCHGLIIPDHLLVIHGEVAQFEEALHLCEQLRYKLNQIDKNQTSTYRMRGNLQQHLKTVEEDMRQSRFWCVCPACDGGTENNCEVCQNRRYFTDDSKNKIKLDKFLKNR